MDIERAIEEGEHDWTEIQRVLKRNERKLPKVDLDVDAYKNEPATRIRAAWEISEEIAIVEHGHQTASLHR